MFISLSYISVNKELQNIPVILTYTLVNAASGTAATFCARTWSEKKEVVS